MHIVVNPELKAYIDPLTPDEYEALERSVLAEGCRDALVLWGDTLVDGHNRYRICQQHGLPFQTVQNSRFQSLEDVYLWLIGQHLGRRSVSDFQRGVLALRQREIVAAQRQRALAERAGSSTDPHTDTHTDDTATPAPSPLKSREALARAARLSSAQVVAIEKIQKQAAPELVAAVKSGQISLSAAAAVASLPAPEQVAAATAGPAELKLAAKRVREAQRKPRPAQTDSAQAASPTTEASAEADATDTPDLVQTLQRQVAALQAENAALRQQVQTLEAQLV
jgi:hypothetical protein